MLQPARRISSWSFSALLRAHAIWHAIIHAITCIHMKHAPYIHVHMGPLLYIRSSRACVAKIIYASMCAHTPGSPPLPPRKHVCDTVCWYGMCSMCAMLVRSHRPGQTKQHRIQPPIAWSQVKSSQVKSSRVESSRVESSQVSRPSSGATDP